MIDNRRDREGGATINDKIGNERNNEGKREEKKKKVKAAIS